MKNLEFGTAALCVCAQLLDNFFPLDKICVICSLNIVNNIPVYTCSLGSWLKPVIPSSVQLLKSASDVIKLTIHLNSF